MKLITKDIDYTVKALIHIDKIDTRSVSVNELFEELKIPKPFLRKILQILNRNNILTSTKGKGGGFKLNKRLDEINIIDLINIFKGGLDFTDCIFNKRVCGDVATCKLRQKVKKLEKNVISELEGVTIASLI